MGGILGGGGGGGGGKGKKLPKMMALKQAYGKGVHAFQKYLPQMIRQESRFRQTEDPRRVQQQLALQKKYGTQMYGQQKQAISQLDPNWQKLHDTTLGMAQKDLAQGYSLGPDLDRQLTAVVRGAQAASGNTEGNSAISAETIYRGKAMTDLYNQRMQNALGANNAYNTAQYAATVQPVQADRSFAYMDPNAGWQGANYQTGMAQYNLGRAAAAMPQQSSSSTLGSIGSAIGTVAPILMSAFGASDKRLKTNIQPTGEKLAGHKLYSYKFKDTGKQGVGVLAQEVEKKQPDAVHTDPSSGLKMVNYAKLAFGE
jgi:hypothetical protein